MPSHSSLHIRPLADDLPRLVTIAQKDDTWADYISKQITRGLFTVLVAEQAATIVGYILCKCSVLGINQGKRRDYLPQLAARRAIAMPESLIVPQHVGDIREVFVTSDWRRQGIGTALVRQCRQYLETQAVWHLQATVPVSDQGLECFFQRANFVPMQSYHNKVLHPSEGAASAIKPLGRPATKQDIPQLGELISQQVHYQISFAPHLSLADDIDWHAYVAAKLQQRDMQILVVEKAKRIVAFVELWLMGSYHAPLTFSVRSAFRHFARRARPQRPTSGIIQDIYVMPRARQQGIASGLLFDSHHWFQRLCVSNIKAAIWQGNDPSRQLFRKFGYETVEIVNRYNV